MTYTNTIEIYSDGSVNPKSNTGVGAISIVFYDINPDEPSDRNKNPPFQTSIQLKTFHDVTCSRLELLAALWALMEFESKIDQLKPADPLAPFTIILYTDSKTIAELPQRRSKLETNDFNSRRTGNKLSNGELYSDFFEIFDRLNLIYDLQIHWLKGHTPKSKRSRTQQNFSEIDKAARTALRKLV